MRVFDTSGSAARTWSGREVCDILSKKEFFYSAAAMLPEITDEEVDDMFEEACEQITRRTLRLCVEEGGWREIMLENGRKLYANVISKTVQWRKPFDEACFRDSSGVDVETFVTFALQQNLLIRGPYSSFVAMKPEDFWPHAETFLRQKIDADFKSE